MQVVRKLMVGVLALFVAASSWAQVQQARGKASVTYAGKAATAEDKARALAAAQLKAVELHYAEAGESEAENFDAIRDRILADPGRYILETTTLAEEDKPDLRQYSVAVRVSLNVANLRNAVKAGSAVVKGGPAARSPLAFVFVSRQVDSTRSFDDRVYKRVDEKIDAKGNVNSAEKGSEGESIRKAGLHPRRRVVRSRRRCSARRRWKPAAASRARPANRPTGCCPANPASPPPSRAPASRCPRRRWSSPTPTAASRWRWSRTTTRRAWT
jgi:hypothetical protein